MIWRDFLFSTTTTPTTWSAFDGFDEKGFAPPQKFFFLVIGLNLKNVRRVLTQQDVKNINYWPVSWSRDKIA